MKTQSKQKRKRKARSSLLMALAIMLMQFMVPISAFAVDQNGTGTGGTGNINTNQTTNNAEVEQGAYGKFVNEGVYVPSQVTPEVITDFMSEQGTQGKMRGDKKQQAQLFDIAKKHKADAGGVQISITGPGGSGSVSQVTEEGYKKMQVFVASAARKTSSKNRVNDMGVKFNISADTEQAAVALAGFLPLVRLLVGILLYVITIGMTVFSAFDLIYITSPVFREKSEGMAQSGNSMVSKQTSDGGSKFRWVTDEAIYAVKTCNVENGKSAIFMYLKKRIVAYVALGVVIYVLFTGSVDVIVQLAINLVAGAMEALGNLGI